MSQDEKLKGIPVLLVSALPIASKELREMLEQFNATGVVKGILEKPFELDSLMAEIQKAAARS